VVAIKETPFHIDASPRASRSSLALGVVGEPQTSPEDALSAASAEGSTKNRKASFPKSRLFCPVINLGVDRSAIWT
jgi:hypothetical protein